MLGFQRSKLCIPAKLPIVTFANSSIDTSCYFLYYVETVAKGGLLGEFEHLVLLAVLRLSDAAYGMNVRREIAERTGRDVSIGAVYATLDRLAAKGLVTSALSDPTPERGGRAKRSFRLTGAGINAVNRTRQDLSNMLEGLEFPAPGVAR
jgi:PadR family transcriptional regulator, regulatory protein PadR